MGLLTRIADILVARSNGEDMAQQYVNEGVKAMFERATPAKPDRFTRGRQAYHAEVDAATGATIIGGFDYSNEDTGE